MFRRLPSVNIEALLGEMRRDHCSPRELSSSKRLDRTLRALNVLVLDVDLSNADAGARTSGAGNLCLDNGAVLCALFFDVFFDFCHESATVQNQESWTSGPTIILLIVDELVRGNHVHQADDTAMLEVVGSRAGEHGDGTDTTVQAGSLLHSDRGARDLEIAVAERDVVEAFNDCVDDFSVGVLAESDALVVLARKYK
jgi:hypothetical protein